MTALRIKPNDPSVAILLDDRNHVMQPHRGAIGSSVSRTSAKLYATTVTTATAAMSLADQPVMRQTPISASRRQTEAASDVGQAG